MKGIDVSEHNGVINWELVKSQIDFAILRLGCIGDNVKFWLDSYFTRNYNECIRLNIPIGVYVYSYTNEIENIKEAGRQVADYLKDKILKLPVYIDMEDPEIEIEGVEKLTQSVIEFNTKIEESGKWAGVYANLNWFNNFLNKDLIKKKYTTWIAHYGVDENKYNGEYDILQYTPKGKVSGINGNVDMNIMYRNLIQEISGYTPTPTITKKSNDEIANEVIAGKFGNYPERKELLEKEGYNYTEIQNIVNEKLKYKNEITYTVKKGDTLSSIANKFNTTWQNIYNDNKSIIGNNPNLIRPGQILNIKK